MNQSPPEADDQANKTGWKQYIAVRNNFSRIPNEPSSSGFNFSEMHQSGTRFLCVACTQRDATGVNGGIPVDTGESMLEAVTEGQCCEVGAG